MFRSVILRIVLPLALASCVVAYFGLPYIQRLLAEWFSADVEARAQLVMQTVQDPLAELVGQGSEARLRNYLAKMTADERLLGALVCRPDGTTIAKSERAPSAISCEEDGKAKPFSASIVQLPSGSVEVSRFDFDTARPTPYRVVMLSDLSFVDRRQRTARDFILVFVGISILLLALLVVLVAWLALRRWVNVLIGDIRGKRFLDDAQSPRSTLPILSQVRQVLAEVEEKQRLEIDFRENWTPQALRQVVRDHLHSSQVIIVSNREPYIHNFNAEHHADRAGAGERHGHGARAHHARVLGRLDRARCGHRGQADRRPLRPHPRAARRPVLHLAAGLAHRGAGAGLLLRLLQ